MVLSELYECFELQNDIERETIQGQMNREKKYFSSIQ